MAKLTKFGGVCVGGPCLLVTDLGAVKFMNLICKGGSCHGGY